MGVIDGLEHRLANEAFTSRARPEVVEEARRRLDEARREQSALRDPGGDVVRGMLADTVSPLLIGIVALVGYVAVLWVATAYFVWRDARRRSASPTFHLLALLLGFVPPFLGALVYLVIRPPRTLDEERAFALEEQSLRELDADPVATAAVPLVRQGDRGGVHRLPLLPHPVRAALPRLRPRPAAGMGGLPVLCGGGGTRAAGPRHPHRLSGRVLSAGLRLVLAVAAPLVGARSRPRASPPWPCRGGGGRSWRSRCCAGLTLSVASGVAGGGSLERSFGAAIPGVDLTARADSAAIAVILIGCLAALLAIPRRRQ